MEEMIHGLHRASPGWKKKENIKVYTLPGGSHRTRIGSFDKKTQEEIMTLINRWLKE